MKNSVALIFRNGTNYANIAGPQYRNGPSCTIDNFPKKSRRNSFQRLLIVIIS